MSIRKAALLLIVALVIVGLARAGVALRPSGDEPVSLRDLSDIDGGDLADLPPVGNAIQFFLARIEQNPQSAVNHTFLGQAYLRQARQTGDVAAYRRSEEALRMALGLAPNYSTAKASLASTLYAQHGFAEALGLARQVYETGRGGVGALATVGDAHLALGNYGEAEDAYLQLLDANPSPSVLARLSQLEFLKGDSDQALDLMRRAANEELNGGQSRDDVAWYLTRLGELHFNSGNVDESAALYEASLRTRNGYYVALAGLARAEAARGRYIKAISLYEHSISIVPQPAVLAALGDLYFVTGDTARAQLQYDTVEVIRELSAAGGTVYNRDIAMFYADHDIHLDDALSIATDEIEVRKDVYGYDALAWALFKNGRLDEAATAIDEALKLGTPDAKIHYHAGKIRLAMRQNERARQHLERVLELNPGFSVLLADDVIRTLDTIDEKLATAGNSR